MKHIDGPCKQRLQNIEMWALVSLGIPWNVWHKKYL